MPDIAASRPVSGQPVETAWGQQVHDQVEGVQSGSVSVTAASGTGNANVTFPRAYLTPPIVVACIGSNGFYFACVTSPPTTTGVTVGVRDLRDAQAGTGSLTVYWIAIGTPA